MKTHLCKITVVYSDTDQMGVVHHSNYLKFYETARWKLFKHWDIPYKKIEENGFLLPVISAEVTYMKPAFYDEELTIETTLKSFEGAKLSFAYKLFNASGELINYATVTVGFISMQTRKACRPPAFITEKIALAINKMGVRTSLKHATISHN